MLDYACNTDVNNKAQYSYIMYANHVRVLFHVWRVNVWCV